MIDNVQIPLLPFQYHFENKFSIRDSLMKNKVEKFVELIENAVKSRKNFDKLIGGYLNETFDMRISAIKWMVQNKRKIEDANIAFIDFEKDLLKVSQKRAFSDLTENIKFALRTCQRVTKRLEENNVIGKSSKFDIEKVHNLNYDGLITELYFVLPSGEYDKLIGWLNASLMLEIGLLTCLIFLEEDLILSKSKINQISISIAKNAQLFSSYATQLGLISHKRSFVLNPSSISEKIISEEKQLAEIGLTEFTQSI